MDQLTSPTAALLPFFFFFFLLLVMNNPSRTRATRLHQAPGAEPPPSPVESIPLSVSGANMITVSRIAAYANHDDDFDDLFRPEKTNVIRKRLKNLWSNFWRH
jgi:hypothetical protein